MPTHASRYRPEAPPDYSHRVHAGEGRYPFAPTGEWTEGIGRLWRRERLNGSGVLLVRPPRHALEALVAAAPVPGACCATPAGVWSLRVANWQCGHGSRLTAALHSGSRQVSSRSFRGPWPVGTVG